MGNSRHSAIIIDENLYVCGYNSYGQLGLGFATPDSPCIGADVFTKLGEEKWKQVSGSLNYTMAIKQDGTLWGWGYNGYGNLGLGNTISPQLLPTQVGTDNDWKQVSCGNGHTMAIKQDGTLWGWGRNDRGMLGLGNKTNRNSPVQVGTDNDWKQVSCGDLSTMAIKQDGTLWGWGQNAYGELFIGAASDYQLSPIQSGTDNDWERVSSGFYGYTMAIKQDGTLWGAGYNNMGMLGTGDTTNRNSPVQVGTDLWEQVSCGEYDSLAIKQDGTIWNWGRNIKSPTQVSTDNDWKQVYHGDGHTMAIKQDGTLWTWGNNTYGQLGLGNTTSQSVPVQVPNLVEINTLMDSNEWIRYFLYLYLIKTLDNKIQYIFNNSWVDTGLTEPLTEQNFRDYKMKDLSVITSDQWVELGDNFEVLYWTDNIDNIQTPKLQLTVPEYKPYKLLDNPEILSWTDSASPLNLTISGYKDLTIGSNNPKVLVYNDESKTPSGTETGILNNNYYKYKVEIDDTTTPDNPDNILVPLTDWLTTDVDSNVVISAGYINKLNPYNIKITVNQFNDYSLDNSGQILLYNQTPFFILGTVSYNMLSVTIDDPDVDTIQYQIMLNGTKIYPTDTDWSVSMSTPCPIMYKFDSTQINIGDTNTCIINVKDQFGTTASLNLSFIGDYAGLLFADDLNNYYSTDAGEIIKQLDFGVIVAGFSSNIATVKLINKNYYSVNNIRLTLDKSAIQPYTDVKLSKTSGDNFIEQDNLIYNNTLNSGDELVFYCRINSGILATGGSLFNINVKADVVM